MAKKHGIRTWNRTSVACYKCRKMVSISKYSNHDCKAEQLTESKKPKKKPKRLKTYSEGELNKPYTLADLKADSLTASRKHAGFVKK